MSAREVAVLPAVGEQLLGTLTSAPGKAFNADELAARLGTTRAGVWKAVEDLRANGYPVEASATSYWLPADLPIACPEAAGYHYYATVESTQDVARQLARQGAPSLTTVFAERQSAGRGRGGGAWVGAAGCGLAFTVVLRPPISAAELAPLPLLAGVAVCEAIAAVASAKVGLKWPNDVLGPDGRKVAGMLVEAEVEDSLPHFALVGIGVNVRPLAFPDGLPAASLEEYSGKPINRSALLDAIIARLHAVYAQLLERGPADGITAWRANSCTLGRTVTVRRHDGSTWEGLARDIDDNGALVIETAQGTLRRVVSGEVTLRHMPA